MRHLKLEGKIIIFQTLAISKVAFLSLISKVLTEVISDPERIENTFLWPSQPKIKNETYALTLSLIVWKKHTEKNIQKKIISLHCAWVRRLYGDPFYEWKVIPLELIEKSFGSHFKFHSNLLFNVSCFNHLPSLYQDIFCNWKNIYLNKSRNSTMHLCQYLWFNKFIIVDNSFINFTNFSAKDINLVVSDLVN